MKVDGSGSGWCEKCDEPIAAGEEDYKTCDTICCGCRYAYMNDEDVKHNGVFYGACCAHAWLCENEEHDGLGIEEQTYITDVDGVLVCVHRFKGKFKINPDNLKIRECYESHEDEESK
jgi:hypothetical protein